MIVRAGLHGFPYFARLGKWGAAATMLQRTVYRDSSPGTIAAVLPLVQRVVAATRGTEREAKDHGLFASVLQFAGRTSEAEALLRELIPQAAARGEFATASAGSGFLANLLRDTGRPRGALQVLEQKAEYTRRAGHGPWTQLADEVVRLQIRNVLREHRDVLPRVMELLEQMRQMPDPPEQNDSLVDVWNVREITLDTGQTAALGLEDWQQALELNEEIIRSMMNRGAGPLEIARVRFNDHGPLLRLGRYQEAGKLLLRCRDVFERERAARELGLVFSGLAQLESGFGHNEAALRFEQSAIRYKYATGTPDSIRASHFGLANQLTRSGGGWGDVLGHRLAATMINSLSESGGPQQDIAAVAGDLRRAGHQASAALPGDFAALCATVQQVEGVRFRELMQRLQPDEATLNQLLQGIIAGAQELAKTMTSASHDDVPQQAQDA